MPTCVGMTDSATGGSLSGPSVLHRPIRKGAVLGLVGESDCDKTTLGRLLLRLIHADSDSLSFSGNEIAARPPLTFRRRAQIVFQNPDTSLFPRHAVDATVRRPLQHFGIA